MQVVSGDVQNGTVGQQLGSPITVQVNDQTGAAMSGVGVTFAIGTGGGSVGSGSATTDASGQASTTWTLGTTAGDQQVTASVSSATSINETFTATATPDAPAVISAVSGNNQFGFMGTKLADSIVVEVRDQFANAIPNHLVEFTAASGNGTLDSAVAFTNDQGQAITGWTMPASAGVVTAEASSTGLTGSPVTFSATSHDTQILTVTDPLVEGQAAVITGTGFDTDPAQNVVTIGSVQATVTTATGTQLDITVPSTCMPLGSVSVDLVSGGIPAVTANSNFASTDTVNLAAGDQFIVEDPNDFCLQFDETADTEWYLIGIQNINETATNRTEVMVTSDAAGSGTAAPPALSLATRQAARRLDLDPKRKQFLDALLRRRIAHAEHMAREFQNFELSSPILRAQGRAPTIPAGLQVGDMVAVNMIDQNGTCDDFQVINATVRVVGAGSVWLEDDANPSAGFSTADFQSFSDWFDNTVMPTNESYFGALSDTDGNGYVAVLVTKEVNRRNNVAGFVSPQDFQTQANCAGSNEGEIFYAWTPDEGSEFGDSLGFDIALELMPIIAAHETVHVIQVGTRTAAGSPLQDLWELEGQASMGEEVNGHAALGNTTGQNYDNDVAFDIPGTEPIDWYFGAFVDLFFYYGADLSGPTPFKINGAPEDCTWLDNGINHVCIGGLVNGVPFSFLRWLNDQFAANFVGGEQELQTSLVDNDLTGFANIADIIGEPIETLLAQWAAMLYVDDRILSDGTPVTQNAILTLPSWDMFSLFDGTLINGGDVHRLEPSERGFADFAVTVNVRAGATAYFVVSGDGRNATALRARNGSDNTLPAHMQVWAVRLR